jgi:hypothetical protein
VLTTLATLPTYALALFLLPPVPLPVMVRSFAIGSGLPALPAGGNDDPGCGHAAQRRRGRTLILARTAGERRPRQGDLLLENHRGAGQFRRRVL